MSRVALDAAMAALGRPWWLGLAVGLIVFGAKLCLIDIAGSDLPVWDQWDAEGAYLYRPYIDGTLQAKDFFAPHNEHRILFTRLLALGLLALNGQWDPVLQMVVNALIHAALIGTIAAMCSMYLSRRVGIAAAPGLAALFAVPAAWENTLSGFQSQFYFLLLFAFLHLAGTALSQPGSWRLWIAQLAGVCALFTMASGVGSAAAVIALVLLDAIRGRQWSRTRSLLLLINFSWLILGVYLRVEHPGHEFLRAASLGEYGRALLWLLAWPTRKLWLAPLLILPFIVLLVRWWRSPSPLRTTLLGLGGWWLLQVLLLAYARGTGVDSPRYFDLLTLGLAVAWIAWLDWLFSTVGASRWVAGAGAAAWLGFVSASLIHVQVDVFRHLAPTLHEENLVREAIVREQVEHPSPQFLKREPGVELPYPWADRLAQLLTEPSLRRILPPSIRLPLPLTADSSVSHGMGVVAPASTSADLRPEAWGRDDRDAGGSASFGSRELKARTSRVLIRAIGSAGELRVEPLYAQPRVLVVNTVNRWISWAPVVGGGAFRLYANTPAQEWILFTAPVEVGGSAWLARQVATRGLWMVFAGGVVLVIAIGARRKQPTSVVGSTPSLAAAHLH